MKKTLMVAASLMLGSAGLAQTEVATDAGLNSATGGYPACSSTITDRCIQLYERGVGTSANLALNNNMGTDTAMGGPYEPVETHSAMNTTEGALNSNDSGVGGPTEARTSYPPCDPGPGDDSCIQLYERGVTGSGN